VGRTVERCIEGNLDRNRAVQKNSECWTTLFQLVSVDWESVGLKVEEVELSIKSSSLSSSKVLFIPILSVVR